MRIWEAQKHTDPDADPDKMSKRIHKTVENKVFLIIFAWWWKDLEPDPYLWLADPGGQKYMDPTDADPDPQHCYFQIVDAVKRLL